MNRDRRLVDEWVVSMRRIPEPLRVPNRVLDAIDRLCAKPSRKPSKVSAPGRSRKERKEERRETTGRVREKAWLRAAEDCETAECECGCGRVLRDGWELDHFFGGSSRKESNTLEGCWALSPDCHIAKTRSSPDRDYWLRLYGDHCTRYGYTEQLKKVDAALALDAGKHPQRSSGTR